MQTANRPVYRVFNATRGVLLAERACIASTSAERRRGLLGREHLVSGEGLLIAPCECVHTFGMRFPIDVVFFSRRRAVLKVAAALPKRRITFCVRAAGVLELQAGAVEKSGTECGDHLVLERAS